jgi:hypothetical protein
MVLVGCFCAGLVGCKDTVVEVVPVSEIVVSPPNGNLSVGVSQQLTATLKSSGGHTLGGRSVSWSSSNSAVATVSQDGVVTGAGAGTATISATSEGRSGSATVTVPTSILTVTKAGTGAGMVTSNPPGIDCPTGCSASFANGLVVTLTAMAAPGATFGGWSGACTGTASTCQVTMSQARSLTVTFNPYTPLPVENHGFTEAYPNTAYYGWSYGDESATRFEIDYRVGGAAWTSVEFPASTRAVVASDLPSGFFLEFRIRACGVMGCSVYSTIAAASGPLTPSVTKVAIPSSQSSLSGAWLSTTYYRVYVPPSAGLTELTIKTFGGTGDVDLYVRQGRVPVLSTELWDCRSKTLGNADSCTFTSPSSGDYYILLYGYVAYSGVTLEVTAAMGGGAVPELSPEGPSLEGPRIMMIPG